MSESRGLAGIAIVIILLFAIWTAWGLGRNERFSTYGVHGNEAACAEGDYTHCDTRPLILDPATGEYISPDTKSQAARDEYRSEKDLTAQRDMAAWAAGMFFATLFGVVLLFLTLHETRKTAEHAEKMLDEQRLSGERTLRAYVCPAGGNILDLVSTKIPYAVVDLKNCGQTPAQDLRAVIKIQSTDDFPNADRFFFGKVAVGHKGVLAPAAKFFPTSHFARTLTDEEIARIKSGADTIYVAGIYSYRDAFKKRRCGVFKYTLNFQQIDKDGKVTLMPCAKGNRAN